MFVSDKDKVPFCGRFQRNCGFGPKQNIHLLTRCRFTNSGTANRLWAPLDKLLPSSNLAVGSAPSYWHGFLRSIFLFTFSVVQSCLQTRHFLVSADRSRHGRHHQLNTKKDMPPFFFSDLTPCLLCVSDATRWVRSMSRKVWLPVDGEKKGKLE